MKTKKENHGQLEEEIRAAINRSSAENGSNTPDFILAKYLMSCLDAFNNAVNYREKICTGTIKELTKNKHIILK